MQQIDSHPFPFDYVGCTLFNLQWKHHTSGTRKPNNKCQNECQRAQLKFDFFIVETYRWQLRMRWENKAERSERRKRKHKKVMEGSERMEVFDDTAGVYRAKWLCLSIQLKWIKGCSEWQTNLAPLATQFPKPDLLALLCPPVLTSALLLPSPLPHWSLLLSPLLFMLVSQLICYSIKATVLLLCIASEPPTRLANTSAPIPLFHVKKIRSADWFVFVSRCSAAATAIGNP